MSSNATMNCSNCGHSNPEDYRYCEACGSVLDKLDTPASEAAAASQPGRACPQCGAENPDPYRFCEDCGASLFNRDETSASPDRGASQETAIHKANEAFEGRAAEADSLACPECGGLNPLDFRFCADCGRSLADETFLTAPAPRPEVAAGPAPLMTESPAETKPAAEITDWICPDCNGRNPGDFRFCADCGAERTTRREPLPLPEREAAIQVDQRAEGIPRARRWTWPSWRKAIPVALGLAALALGVSYVTRLGADAVSPEEAQELAGEAIRWNQPDLAGVEPKVGSFEQDGHAMQSFSYFQQEDLVAEDGTKVNLSSGALVIVDRTTGEITILSGY